MSAEESWRPTASVPLLRQRAALLARVREFFAARAVTEVDTPIVVNAPVSDVHIHSAVVRRGRGPAPPHTPPPPRDFHTTPA
ncbi:MAG: hypothetical protein ACTHL7_12910 [Steroidobacteraceae bacterium]